MSAALQTEVRRHRLTVDEFHRMGEAGILRADERVELIDGEVIDMAPIGSNHAGTVGFLAKRLERALGDSALVFVQNPLSLTASSEPQPDIMLLKPRADFYRSGHPRPEEVLLIVEVADTTLAYDRDIKVPLYARHCIPEAWLVDLENKRLHVFTSPSDTGYLESHSLARPGVVATAALPGSPVVPTATFKKHESRNSKGFVAGIDGEGGRQPMGSHQTRSENRHAQPLRVGGWLRTARAPGSPRQRRCDSSALPPETHRRLSPEFRGGILQAPCPNQTLQPTPWIAVAFPSRFVRLS